MLCASRLSYTHAPAAQTLSAEPAGAGGRVATEPPTASPPLQPPHDPASATTPARLPTCGRPPRTSPPPRLGKTAKPAPSPGTREILFPQACTAPPAGMATPKVPTQALPQIMPDDRCLVVRAYRRECARVVHGDRSRSCNNAAMVMAHSSTCDRLAQRACWRAIFPLVRRSW